MKNSDTMPRAGIATPPPPPIAVSIENFKNLRTELPDLAPPSGDPRSANLPNGTHKLSEPSAEVVNLPDHRQRQVEAGMAYHQKVLAERDSLDARLSEACKTIAALRVQLESLQSVVGMMESSYHSARIQLEGQVAKYQAQRDDAITRTASLEAVIALTFTNLKQFINGRDDVALEEKKENAGA